MTFLPKGGVMLLPLISSVLSAILPISHSGNQPHKLVCYFGSWSNYRNGNGKFIVEDINPFLCTHLVYAFAKLEQNRIAAYDPYLDLEENWGLGAYKRFNGLKKVNPNLKTLLAIGGWNEGSEKYSRMVSSKASRMVFINSCVEFLLRHDFDGLDLDWEYPANRGGHFSDKSNFVSLLKEMQEAFKVHSLSLSAAVGAGKATVESAYDIPEISRYLDFINLMTYDFHGSWDTVTGHNAPLYPRPNDSDANKMLTVDYAVNLWINAGAPSEKIVLGMALYGRSFTLQDSKDTGIGARVTGGGKAGKFTQEQGMLGYNEICDMMRSDDSWTVVFDKYYKAPYAFKGRQWVGYDDIESLSVKVNYIKEMNLGGGMVWSIETDDFKQLCEGISYPLLTTIRRGLNIPTTAQSLRPTKGLFSRKPNVITPNPFPLQKYCPNDGYFRDTEDCQKFYLCFASSYGGYQVYDYICPAGTLFSEKDKVCNHPVNVPECKRS